MFFPFLPHNIYLNIETIIEQLNQNPSLKATTIDKEVDGVARSKNKKEADDGERRNSWNSSYFCFLLRGDAFGFDLAGRASLSSSFTSAFAPSADGDDGDWDAATPPPPAFK